MPNQGPVIEIFNVLISANMCKIWVSFNIHLVCGNLEGRAFRQIDLGLTT